MQALMYAFLALFPNGQEEDTGTKIRDIVLLLPQYYLDTAPQDVLDGCEINSPPQDSHWHFYFQAVDHSGKPKGKPEQVDLSLFYGRIRGILSLGVKDSVNISDPELNASYVTFVRTLLNCGIFNQQTINWAAEKYFSSHWVESCYYLEEAVGRQFTDEQWQDLHDHPYGGGTMTPYFEVLVKIRLARGDIEKLKAAREYLNSNLLGDEPEQPNELLRVQRFSSYCKAYAELQRNGIPFIAERVSGPLFDLYFDLDSKMSNFPEVYETWGLPPPSSAEIDASLMRVVQKPFVRLFIVRHFRGRNLAFPEEQVRPYLLAMVDALENHEAEDFQYLADMAKPDLRKTASAMLANRLKTAASPILAIVQKFRALRLAFPKELAASYRDLMLEEFGQYDFTDVEYLLQYSGDANLQPEALKRYGDQALDWHFNQENVHRKEDGYDYYHAATECYRRLQPIVAVLEEQANPLAQKSSRNAEEEAKYRALTKRITLLTLSRLKKDKLLEAVNDLNVRMRDVIWVYRLSNREPKTDELAMRKLDQRIERCQARPTGAFFDRSCKMFWRRDDYGRPLIPFREEIELAAYLNDAELTHKITLKIVDSLVEQIKQEGVQILAEFEHNHCTSPTDSKERQRQLESSETPVYANLNAIIDLMIYLEFRDGLYGLAQRLHDAAFDLPARKVFRLAGIEKESDAKYYGKHDEAYWLARERRFNYEMRVHGYFDNTK